MEYFIIELYNVYQVVHTVGALLMLLIIIIIN